MGKMARKPFTKMQEMYFENIITEITLMFEDDKLSYDQKIHVFANSIGFCTQALLRPYLKKDGTGHRGFLECVADAIDSVDKETKGTR